MDIRFRHFNADESWNHILWSYEWYWKHGNRYYKDVSRWIPKCSKLESAFLNSDKREIQSLREYFIADIYNEKDLMKHNEYIQSSLVPDLTAFVRDFGAIMQRQSARVPDACAINTAYGNGGSYNAEIGREQMTLRVSEINDSLRLAGIAKHEFVHILIENQIIKKYNIPQDVKESIVDIICELYFAWPPQNFPVLPFVRKYIGKESIENDLARAAKNMMDDYANTRQAKQNESAER